MSSIPLLHLFPKTESGLGHDIRICLGKHPQHFGMKTLLVAYVVGQ